MKFSYQTGMGRTGKLWGYQNFDVEPDVFTSAKVGNSFYLFNFFWLLILSIIFTTD